MSIIVSDLDMALVADEKIVHQIRAVLQTTLGGIPPLAIIAQKLPMTDLTCGQMIQTDPTYTMQWVDDRDDLIKEMQIENSAIANYMSTLDQLFSVGYRLTQMPVLYAQRESGENISLFIGADNIVRPLITSKKKIANPGPRVALNPFLVEFATTIDRLGMFVERSANPIFHAVVAAFGVFFGAAFLAYLTIMGESIIPRIANALQSIPWFAGTDYAILYIIGMLFSVTDIFVFLTSNIRMLTIIGWVSQGIGGMFHLWYGLTHPMGNDISDLVLSAILSISVAFGGELALVFLFLLAATLLPTTLRFPLRIVDIARRWRSPKKKPRGYGRIVPACLVEECDPDVGR